MTVSSIFTVTDCLIDKEPIMLLSRGMPLCAIVVCLPLVGCGPSLPAGARPTEPVTVTVTYNGQPVEGATVTFISQDADPVAAYGRTDAQGVAKMKTYVEGDGAVLGKHKVTINKTETTGGGSEMAAEPRGIRPGRIEVPTISPRRSSILVPQKYNSPATSESDRRRQQRNERDPLRS